MAVKRTKDIKQLEKKTKDAIKSARKIINDVSKKVIKDFGKIKVKYKEGSVVKKARIDLAGGLEKLAKKLKKSAKLIKKEKK